jgi:hypothetical protein
MAEKVCPMCGYANTPNARRCKKCAYVFPDEPEKRNDGQSQGNISIRSDDLGFKYYCPTCGHSLLSGSFCTQCRKSVQRVFGIEIEADTESEALNKFDTAKPQGYDLWKQIVIQDEHPKTMTASAETVELATASALSQLPPRAIVTSQRVVHDAARAKITVIENSEKRAIESAKWDAKVRYGIDDNAIIEAVKLVSRGSRGFLGIGKKPEHYEVSFFSPAVIELIYQPKLKILFQIACEDEKKVFLVETDKEKQRLREEDIDRLINSLLYEYHSPKEKKHLIDTLRKIGEEAGDIRSIRPRLHCKSCRRSFSKDEANVSESDYDDGWFTRKTFCCPVCRSDLYDALGDEYSEVTQN